MSDLPIPATFECPRCKRDLRTAAADCGCEYSIHTRIDGDLPPLYPPGFECPSPPRCAQCGSIETRFGGIRCTSCENGYQVEQRAARAA